MKSIIIKNLSKSYQQGRENISVLKSIDLRIEQGEFFFLLGPSGCGKTTLLRIIAGLTEPDSGQIFFDDKDVTHLSPDKRDTALVFQSYALWPHMTVQKNVEFGLKMKNIPAAKRALGAAEQLERVQMSDYASRKPNQLSGGQQQRVAVARALAAGPDYLLLDEPLSNLDARLRIHMRTELRQLVKSSRITAVYVTHDQTEALSMADRIAIMKDGEICQIGTPEDIYHHPVSCFVADFIGEANFIEGQIIEVGDLTRIDTAAGTLKAINAENLTANTEVQCCIRPENIRISAEPDTAGGMMYIPATISEVVNQGEVHLYIIELADRLSWKIKVLSNRECLLKSGQKVHLEISPQDIIVLKD